MRRYLRPAEGILIKLGDSTTARTEGEELEEFLLKMIFWFKEKNMELLCGSQQCSHLRKGRQVDICSFFFWGFELNQT